MQETRLWDEIKLVTTTMRKKEGLADYRLGWLDGCKTQHASEQGQRPMVAFIIQHSAHGLRSACMTHVTCVRH